MPGLITIVVSVGRVSGVLKNCAASTVTAPAATQHSTTTAISRRRKFVYSGASVLGDLSRKSGEDILLSSGYASRLNTSEPFVPPNPKEFDSTVSIRISRAVFGT